MLQPFNAEAYVAPVQGSRVSGLVNFTDTVGGLRVLASIKGLEPGTYELRADEYFHGPEDATCEVAKNLESAKPPVGWRLGPLLAGPDGIARFDRVYPAVGLSTSAYTVPAEPVMRRKVPLLIIQAPRRFGVSGRKLTLHKRKPLPEGGVGEPVACAIIHYAKPYATTALEPLPGYTVKGSADFQQGEDNRAKLEVSLSNLKPGKYRLVVHEFIDCANATNTGVGEPYHPEDSTIVTQPHYAWPLKNGLLGTFTADKKGTIEDEKTFNHP